MKILKLNLNNYKSFRSSGWLDFSPNFTVVIGQNNAGKSALLEAFRLWANPVRPHRRLETPTEQLANDSFLLFDLSMTGEELTRTVLVMDQEIHVPVPSQPSGSQERTKFARDIFRKDSVVLSLRASFGTGLGAQNYPSHMLFEHRASTSSPIYVPLRGSRREQVVLETNDPQAGGSDSLPLVAQTACSRGVYVFPAERLNIGRTQATEARILNPTGTNLGAVLGTLRENDAWFARYNRHVSEILPSIKQVAVAIVNSEFEVRLWSVDPATERHDLAIPLQESGTGVGQILAILCVVMTVKSGVIVIDEPNSFLHPGAAKKLIQILRQYPQHQYVLATHSADLISTAKPEIIHLARWQDGESKVETVDATKVDDLRTVLAEIGVSFSDLFGYDRAIWVEGPTEEICFPLIVEKLLKRGELGLVFVAVRNTGDFEKKRIPKQLIWEIYAKLSSNALLLPSAVVFSFDREARTDKEIEDLERQSEGRAHFISRLTYENYLIHPDAIAALINSLPREGKPDVTSEQVSLWLTTNGGMFRPNWNGSITHEPWLRKMHAPSLLNTLLNDLASTGDNFEKTSHSKFLTEWLIEHRPDALAELADYVEALVETTI